MPKFKYVAVDPKGKESSGVVEAANQANVIAMIKEQGWFPTAVTEVGGKGGGGKSPERSEQKSAGGKKKQASGGGGAAGGLQMEIKIPGMNIKPRVKTKNISVVTRQLATLLDAGLPLLRGLKVILKQEQNKALRDALNDMGEAIEGGSTFSDALKQHNNIFDDLYVNMVKAGEVGGVLDVVLSRLADFMEKAEAIKRKVKSAMTYPIIVLVIALGILTFMLVGIIPRFEQVFADMSHGQLKLPFLTRVVLGISKGFLQNWIAIVGTVATVTITYQVFKRTQYGRLTLDRIQIFSPVFGPLFRMTAISRFARTLGTLLQSGVPILQALNIVRDTSGNAVIAKAIDEVHDSVKEGESMTSPLEASKAFPSMVVSMIDVGEETGALPEMLMRIADTYEDEVDTAVDGLTSIIEPILIVFLAVVVGTIVIAMFLPLLSLMTELSK